jgi:hypothetical protein
VDGQHIDILRVRLRLKRFKRLKCHRKRSREGDRALKAFKAYAPTQILRFSP